MHYAKLAIGGWLLAISNNVYYYGLTGKELMASSKQLFMYRFENYRVYKSAMMLVKSVYEVIKLLPKEEKFGLIDQLRRSATSIVLNIAEGTGGLGDKEFKSFLRISLKSLYETVAGLKIAQEIHNIDVDEAINQCDKVGKELNALINSIDKSNRGE